MKDAKPTVNEALEILLVAIRGAPEPAKKVVPPEPIDCKLLKEVLDATNELYYTRCIL